MHKYWWIDLIWLFNEFDYIENSYKSDFFSEKTYFSSVCITISELPFIMSTMNGMKMKNLIQDIENYEWS